MSMRPSPSMSAGNTLLAPTALLVRVTSVHAEPSPFVFSSHTMRLRAKEARTALAWRTTARTCRTCCRWIGTAMALGIAAMTMSSKIPALSPTQPGPTCVLPCRDAGWSRSGHHGRERAREKEHGVGDIGRLGEPSSRGPARALVQDLLAVREVLECVGIHDTGGDGVDVDALRCQLDGEMPEGERRKRRATCTAT